MHGVTIAFDTSIWPDEAENYAAAQKFYDEKLRSIIETLFKESREFSISYSYQYGSRIWTMTTKFFWDHQIEFLQKFVPTTTEEFEICDHQNCWQPVAAYRTDNPSTFFFQQTLPGMSLFAPLRQSS